MKNSSNVARIGVLDAARPWIVAWRAMTLLAIVLGSLASSGCWAVRVARTIDSRQATEHFPAKGKVTTARTRTLWVAGVKRNYLVQVPAPGSAPPPIVVLLHGGTQDAEHAWEQTSLPTLAARDRFILAAPNGVDKHWNDGRGSTIAGDEASTADDVGLLRTMIAELISHDHGDPRAVFVIGASNGGFMAMRYACEAGDTLRAGANVISNIPQTVASRCRPSKPLPWLSMNGVKDPLVPFVGVAAGQVLNGKPQPALLSADATFDFWARRAGCSATARTEKISDNVEKRVRSGCAGGATSQQYVFKDSGHVWPGLAVNSPMMAYYLGGTNLEVDTGETAWGFFKSTLTGG